MKTLLCAIWLCATIVARADDPEPAVDTSQGIGAARTAAGTAPQAAAEPSTRPPTAPDHAGPVRRQAGPGAAAGARAAAGSTSAAHDQIELETTQITGNRELPNVMYVVPWKRPDLGEFAGRPPKSLLDEMLAPVDRDVFRRQNRYFAALHPDAAAPPAPPARTPAAGATPTLPGGDEK